MRGRQWRGSQAAEEEDEYENSETPPGTSEVPSGGSSVPTRTDRTSVGPPPGYDGDRKPGAWEDYKLRAKLWLRTTTIAETSRGPRMLQQLSGKAFDTMKFLADDDEWYADRTNGQRLLDEMNRPERFGKEEVESLWSSLHRLLYSRLRQPDDDLVTFRNRFDEATRKVRKHGVSLPDSALGFVYLRQAQVDDSTLERIITMTGGDLSLSAVIEAMHKLKMRLLQNDEEKDKKKPNVWLQHTTEDDISQPGDVHDQVHGPLTDDDELNALESALCDLDDHETEENITEDSAKDILMTLIRQKVQKPVQQFSYRQVQNLKNEVRNGRGFRAPASQAQSSTKRGIQHLKSITQCRNCGQKGHWHRECPKGTSKGSESSKTSNSVAHREDGSSKAWFSLAECMDNSRPSSSAADNPE